MYGTVMGAIGAFYPFSSRQDADFFTHLEMHLRQEHAPLAGRDHMAFRCGRFLLNFVSCFHAAAFGLPHSPSG